VQDLYVPGLGIGTLTAFTPTDQLRRSCFFCRGFGGVFGFMVIAAALSATTTAMPVLPAAVMPLRATLVKPTAIIAATAFVLIVSLRISIAHSIGSKSSLILKFPFLSLRWL
jgi:hypothetical protein